MDFKAMVGDVKKATDALKDAAATLKNKNLSDVIKAASARLGQALEHPDIDSVPAEAMRGHAFGDDEQHGA